MFSAPIAVGSNERGKPEGVRNSSVFPVLKRIEAAIARYATGLQQAASDVALPHLRPRWDLDFA